jgi:hypothetical protein
MFDEYRSQSGNGTASPMQIRRCSASGRPVWRSAAVKMFVGGRPANRPTPPDSDLCGWPCWFRR